MSKTNKGLLLIIPLALFLISLLWSPIALAHDDDDSKVIDSKLVQTVKDNEPIDLQTAVAISHGHVDIGPRILDGKWQLIARDDSVNPSTWRSLDKIVFKMSNKSIQKLPEGEQYSFTGAKAGEKVWVIPQVEKKGVPWLGWSTQSPKVVEQVNGQVKITFEGHQGPGILTVFTQDGNFSAPRLLWDSQKKTAQAINVDTNTHTHVNWVFTKPGIHLVRISMSATLKDGQEVSDSRVLRFAVGDKADSQKALQTVWKGNKPDTKVVDQDTSMPGTDSVNIVMYVAIAILIFAFLILIVAIVTIRRNLREKAQAVKERI